MNRETYAANYGPTTGDRIRLGDTGLLIEVERDDSIAGEEVVSGFGKTQRDGIFVQATADSCDLAILGVVLVDPVLGVRKTSIGIRNGRISAIGRAGNPHTMDGPIDVVLGTGTAIISGQGLIATAGGIDSHVHLVSPRVLDQALASGITTVIGQDYGPVWNLGANPPWALKRMLMSMEAWPINVALLARGSSSLKEPVLRSVEAGAAGLKIHEDVGPDHPCVSHRGSRRRPRPGPAAAGGRAQRDLLLHQPRHTVRPGRPRRARGHGGVGA